jgi:hypothetical protein
MIRVLMFLMAAAVAFKASAQDSKGVLKVFVHPNHAKIMADTILMKGTSQELPAGSYVVKIRCAGFWPVDTTISIAAGSQVTIKQILSPTPEYKLHEAELKKYDRKQSSGQLLPGLLSISAGAYTYYNRNKKNIAKWAVLKHTEDLGYMNDGEEKFQKQELIAAQQNNWDKFRSRTRNGAIITSGALIMTTAAVIRSKRMKVPVFNQDVDFGMNLNPWEQQLTFKYSF